MRLLKRHQTNGGLCFTDDIYDKTPPYAILSHTWHSADEEVSYQDIISDCNRRARGFTGTASYASKAGYRKVEFCLNQAEADDLYHVWIDAACIDRHNAVELTKAINSMFRWYAAAEQCYVYLSDISVPHDDWHKSSWHSAFRLSRWFRRGWTLQELLANRSVSFFSREGTLLGTKAELADLIHKRTKIPMAALLGESLETFSVQERFSWAGQRSTKEPEDRVYSLLGILGISLAQNYGEGQESALERLKDALTKQYHHRLQSLKFDSASQPSRSKDAFANLVDVEEIRSKIRNLLTPVAETKPEHQHPKRR